MRRRALLKAAATAALAAAPARFAIAQGNARVLRCAPEANLASIDPVWTTATVAINHGFMVYDTLFGADEKLNTHPQMAAGHTVDGDGKLYTITLRDGLSFHDGEPVLARDCVASILRWTKRAAWGQALASATEEIKALEDKRLTIRLKRPFALTLSAMARGYCFIMPERMAMTDPFKQITDATGSGPFRFVKDEFVSGARAVWERNEKYIPRDEGPDMFAGGKRVYFDRVEHIVMPDGATAAAALRTGEVDWVHVPTIDLVPSLKKAPNVRAFVNDPFAWIGVIRPNFLHPPFNNRKLLRAILPAVDQQEFLDAVIGEQLVLGKAPVGLFTEGGPMANKAGMEVFAKPDVAKARRLVGESGYAGEKVLLMSPSDQPALKQLTQVTRALFEKVGLNVEYVSMDWSTLVARRASREAPDKGGWNAFCAAWGGLAVIDPGGHFPMRGNGAGAWFGWPDDPKMESLRDAWLDAPDRPAQRKLCEDIQAYAMERVPIIPTGQWFNPTATRANITDMVRSSSLLHWNIRKA